MLTPRPAPAPEAGEPSITAPPAGPGTLVVDWDDALGVEELAAAERAWGLTLDWATDASEDERLRVGEVPDLAAAVAALGADPRVEAVEPVVEMGIDGVEPASPTLGYPNDPMYPRQWNLARVGAPAGWRLGGGRGVVVAVIDTGVSPSAELPSTRVLPGRSFVPGAPTAADDHGHGTHVAGTIAQATHNGMGVAGLAPHARILPIKVLGKTGAGRSDRIASGIDEAVDQGAQVINLSLGGGHSAVVVRAVEKARRAGVVVVAAAGNAGRRGLGSPADAPAALGVSATGPDGSLAPYSNWGRGVELAAPGGDTRVDGGGITQATFVDGKPTFAAWQGTSMASPHVAGAAAVLLGAGAGGADEVEALLRLGARAGGDPERFGSGELDLAAAARRLVLGNRGLRFGSAGLVGLALAWMGAFGRVARAVTPLVAGAVAGGLFFLPLLPLPPNAVLEPFAEPLAAWPGPRWSGCPLWQSALLPLLAVGLLGPHRLFGPVAVGLAGGFGAGMLHGAATGGDLWWMPLGLDRAWLALNGTLAILLGIAGAGMVKLRGAAA